MSDTKFKEALKLFEQAHSVPTLTEYQREQRAIRANYERLKARRSETVADESGFIVGSPSQYPSADHQRS